MKNSKRRASIVGLSAAAAVAAIGFSQPAQAAFQNGQLVVIRVGNGITNIADPNYFPFDSNFKTQPMSLLTYDVTGAVPTLVGSPHTVAASSDSGNLLANQFVLTARGDDNDQKLTLSSDGQHLAVGGYRMATGIGAGVSNYAATGSDPRAVGVFDSNYNFSTSVLSDSAYSGATINAATTSDGTEFWIAGGKPVSNADTGGFRYVPSVGSTSYNLSNTLYGSEVDTYRGLRFAGGRLYASTPSQNGFNFTAPGNSVKSRRGAYWMNVSGALPRTTNPAGINTTPTPIMTSNDGDFADTFGNDDPTAKGEFHPKTDVIFLDLDGINGYDTAYGTGGKEDLQKWHFNGTKWTRNTAVDLVKLQKRTNADLALNGDSEINALDAYVSGGVVNLFLSTDLGIMRIQDVGGLNGGIVEQTPALIQEVPLQTGGFDRVYVGAKYLAFTSADSYQFRGLVMVPEPTGLALLAGAASLLGVRSRKRRI